MNICLGVSQLILTYSTTNTLFDLAITAVYVVLYWNTGLRMWTWQLEEGRMCLKPLVNDLEQQEGAAVIPAPELNRQYAAANVDTRDQTSRDQRYSSLVGQTRGQ
jgi:hypothetical protein